MDELFIEYGINITDNQKAKFKKYYELLTLYNEKFNITAITSEREVYIKHFIDSLLGLEFYNANNFIDIGSGGGFPALPILIMREDICGTLLEATGKKCEFLNTIIKALGLKNAIVVNGRAEELGLKAEYREKFDIVSARAVARLNTLAEYCMPFVNVGGRFISFKGDAKEEIEEGKNAICLLGGEIEKIKEYELDGARRTLIEIKKVKPTDKKYPRGRGKERKNPL